jgi:hypothetical protein
MAEQTLSEETGGRRSRRGVVCRGTMELKESEEAFTRCQPIDKGWTWRLWNLPRPGESVASSSEGACGNKVVSRRLARVGNGWGCDARRSECMNESVWLMVWYVLRLDEMRRRHREPCKGNTIAHCCDGSC